jgi:predicted Zn-dependent protease
MYLGHNYQFLAYATAMEGRRAETLDAVRHLREAVPESLMLEMAGIDWYGAEEYMAMVRFGLWDELLAAPAPNRELKALTGGYLFGRTLALAAKGRQADAEQTLAQLEQLANEVPADMPAGLSSAKDVLAVAVPLARGRLAASAGRTGEALKLLAEAVSREDALAYDEPADWFFPVRHLLGAELMKAGKAAAAERVYREDLKRNPGNGWSLFGLAQALAAQHKDAAANEAEARFRTAWQHADVTLTASTL